ncbi:MAG: M56 family metallopeptidase, partial [Eubacterium sp.]|nr:M56 family metallopeptidase [Eubacterium sp.]
IPPTEALAPTAPAAIDLWEIAAFLWAAVALLLLGRTIVSHVCFLRSLAPGRKPIVLGDTGEKRLSVYTVSADISPFLTGVFLGKVYLPAGRYSAREREMALAHELSHFKSGDAAKRIVLSVLRCLNWFNPPFRLILNRLSAQLEYACDEAVTEKMDREEKKQYGYMLLKTAGFTAERTGLSVGLSRSSKALRQHRTITGYAFAARLTAIFSVI